MAATIANRAVQRGKEQRMLKLIGPLAKSGAACAILALLLTISGCTPASTESPPAMTSVPAAQSQSAPTSAPVVISTAVAASAPAAQSQPTAASQPAMSASPAIADAPNILLAVGAVLNPDTKRDVPRMARATIDTSGDATVVFALRNENDNQEAIVTTALADTLAAFWAIYHSPDTAQVTSATVIGTYNVQGKTGSMRELPVLRAVLTANNAAHLNWNAVMPEQVPDIVDDWWIHEKLAGAVRSRSLQEKLAANWAQAQGDTEGREHKALTPAEVHAQIDLMLVHLNDALFALSGNDVGVARSQFKQFFDKWDGAEEDFRIMYPQQYATLDLELERAELALLHKTPEDINAGRFALRALRTGLLDVAHDLEAKLK
jgi:hypothetical protein